MLQKIDRLDSLDKISNPYSEKNSPLNTVYMLLHLVFEYKNHADKTNNHWKTFLVGTCKYHYKIFYLKDMNHTPTGQIQR